MPGLSVTERFEILGQGHSHGGQYYKFTYADGAELKVIDPATYRVLGWPENGGKTTFQNPSGKVIIYDPVSKTWR